MAALCGVVGLAVWLLHRRKQQNNPADKDDGASSQGSGRRVSDVGLLLSWAPSTALLLWHDVASLWQSGHGVQALPLRQ
jgi:hypothetical protein